MRLRGAATRGGFSAYVCLGHPSMDASVAHAIACIDGGADWLELGIPFSDPAADGPAIQAATHDALEAGATVAACLEEAQRIHEARPDVPLVAMTYANVAHRMGWDAWAAALAAAGFDGCILPDVPLEESGPVRTALASAGVAWAPLVTPTTDLARMRRIAATATGFLYVVGNVGTTGQGDPGALIEATVARAKDAGDAPLAVGFGIAAPEHVRRVRDAGAQGAIVGSHIVSMIHDGATPAQVEAEVRRLKGDTWA